MGHQYHKSPERNPVPPDMMLVLVNRGDDGGEMGSAADRPRNEDGTFKKSTKKASKKKAEKKKMSSASQTQLALIEDQNVELKAELKELAKQTKALAKKADSEKKSKKKKSAKGRPRNEDGTFKKTGASKKKEKNQPTKAQLEKWGAAQHKSGHADIPMPGDPSAPRTISVDAYERARREAGWYHIEPYWSPKHKKEIGASWQLHKNEAQRARANMAPRDKNGRFISYKNPPGGSPGMFRGDGPLGLNLMAAAKYTGAGMLGFFGGRALRTVAAEHGGETLSPHANMIGPVAAIAASLFVVPRVSMVAPYQGAIMAGAAGALAEGLVTRFGADSPTVARFLGPGGEPTTPGLSGWNAYEDAMSAYPDGFTDDEELLPEDFDVEGDGMSNYADGSGVLSNYMQAPNLNVPVEDDDEDDEAMSSYIDDRGVLSNYASTRGTLADDGIDYDDGELTEEDAGLADDEDDEDDEDDYDELTDGDAGLAGHLTDRDAGLAGHLTEEDAGLADDEDDDDFDDEEILNAMEERGLSDAPRSKKQGGKFARWQKTFRRNLRAMSKEKGVVGRYALAVCQAVPKVKGKAEMPRAEGDVIKIVQKAARVLGKNTTKTVATNVLSVLRSASPDGRTKPPRKPKKAKGGRPRRPKIRRDALGQRVDIYRGPTDPVQGGIYGDPIYKDIGFGLDQ